MATQWRSTSYEGSNPEAQAFDASMIGVKGLIDSGITKIPNFLIHKDLKNENKSRNNAKKLNVPVPLIDIEVDGASGNPDKRDEILSKINKACENWGFFQIVNHGIPLPVLNEMVQGIIAFHEQDPEIKKKYYNRDISKRVSYASNLFMYNTPATWKDTVLCKMAPVEPDWEELPEIFRDIMYEYGNHVSRLGRTLLELLSETLGLEKDYLLNKGCAEGLYFRGHYSPPCPEPELTLSTVTHTDFGFLTILLQNEIEGLQVIHEGEYIDVPCVPGALVINIGDIIQLITNDRFKSVRHRALAREVGPRISLAAFVRPSYGIEGYAPPHHWEPIKELLSADNLPVYRPVTFEEYIAFFTSNGMNGYTSLPHFKLEK